MIDVSVCVGSSCHLKGSYEVIRRLQQLLSENGLGDKVSLSGSFCLGACGKGVTVKVGDCLFTAVTPEGTEDLFNHHIKPQSGV